MPDKDQHPTVVLTKNQFSLPRDFGEYRLTEKLGDSMAMVFKAEQKNPKRRVVVKIPRGGLLLTEESRSRFLREVELAANADHAGIVPVLDAGEIDGAPYYTMPYIEGKPIDQYLRSNCPSLEEKLHIFRQLCEVVGTLHAKGLIHRDLKPANVLVDHHGSIRLLDFGLAKAARENSEVSLSPTVMGTLDYMAPEQAGAAKEIGPQADVYAIGIMLYKAVTGHTPYPATKDLPTQLRLIAEATPKSPSEFNRDLPAELEQLIISCLNKDPTKRPETASALGLALQTIDLSSARRSRPAGIWIAVALFAVAMAIAGFLSTNTDEAPTAPLEQIPSSSAAPRMPETSVELESQQFTLQQIQTLSSASRTNQTASDSIPPAYWPLYNQLQQELRDNFDRRRQAAWIVTLPAYASATKIEITQGNQLTRQWIQPGNATVIWIEGGKSAELSYNDITLSLKPQSKQVGFSSLK